MSIFSKVIRAVVRIGLPVLIMLVIVILILSALDHRRS